jgi:hypothetical protein
MEEDKLVTERKGYMEQMRKYTRRADIYLGATVLGFALGIYGIFGIKNNNTLKYSLVGSMAVATGITAELHSRNLRKMDQFRGKLRGLESMNEIKVSEGGEDYEDPDRNDSPGAGRTFGEYRHGS